MPLARRKVTGPIGTNGQSTVRPLTDTQVLNSNTGPLRGGAQGLSPSQAQQVIQQLKLRLHAKIIAELRDTVDVGDVMATRREIERLFSRFIAAEDVILNRTERTKLQDLLIAEILGYGPIQELINDDNVSEIMVNGPSQVWVEQSGRLSLTEIHFQDDEHVMRIINRIVAPLGRHVDEASPMVDARLPDGSRVNVIIPPLSLIGPTISIRKFSRVPLTVTELMQYGSITPKAVTF